MSLCSSRKRRPFKTERHTCEAELRRNDFAAQKHQLRTAYQVSVVPSAVLLSVLYSRYTADFTCDSSTEILNGWILNLVLAVRGGFSLVVCA